MHKRPKIHPELPLGNNHERGTAETFVWHLVTNKVDLSGAKDNIRKYLISTEHKA